MGVKETYKNHLVVAFASAAFLLAVEAAANCAS
jgi:hypothetical protein